VAEKVLARWQEAKSNFFFLFHSLVVTEYESLVFFFLLLV